MDANLREFNANCHIQHAEMIIWQTKGELSTGSLDMYTIIYICTAVLAKVQFWNKTFSVCNVAFLYLKNFALQPAI